jgi:cobalt-zinc-cadmium efflux system protein
MPHDHAGHEHRHEHRHEHHGHGHGHSRDHDHAHGHAHSLPDSTRAFALGAGINLAFVIGETIAGFAANSLALLADAGHNLGDVLGLLLAFGAARLARRLPSRRFTYGLRSSTILAALANAMVLMLVTGGIVVEALQRLLAPDTGTLATPIVIWVALAGIVVNGGSALLFLRDRHHDLNARGAWLHLMADALVSLGVVASALAIGLTGWSWLDALTSLLVAAVIIRGTWGALRDSLTLVLHAVPSGVDAQAVREHLSGLPGVREIHDLHIWAMSTTETALTAHLVMPGAHPGDEFIAGLCRQLADDYGICHATIQVEAGDIACVLAPDTVV